MDGEDLLVVTVSLDELFIADSVEVVGPEQDCYRSEDVPYYELQDDPDVRVWVFELAI